MASETRQIIDAVKDRLKFFFSDANVRQDFFIRKLLMNNNAEIPNSVPVDSLMRFNTIKKHTTDAATLIKAARELEDVLIVHSGDTAISRCVKFTNEMMRGHIPKSLYVKSLPLKKNQGDANGVDGEAKQYAVSVDEVRDLFAKYGEVAMVKFRFSTHQPSGMEASTDENKDTMKAENSADVNKEKNSNSFRGRPRFPTGCAIVEFATEADMEKAAAATLTSKNGEKLEPADKLVLGEVKTELQVLPLSEIKSETRIRDFNRRDNKKRKHKDDLKGKSGDVEENEVVVKKFTIDWKPGCVIKMEGVPADCDREALLDMVAAGMGISVEEVKDKKIYVDYSRGSVDGALRFPELGDHIGSLCKRLKEGDLQVKGSKVESAFLLGGDEEKKYWDDFIAFKNRQNQQHADEKRAKKKQKRHGGRGNRQ